ncbi:MAG: glycine betaine ABC transporter substrate-binding protein [Beijerinckiaceae bacterium]
MPTRRLVLAGSLAAAVTSKLQAATPVVVGSKLDLEGALLGELILLALSRAGIATKNRLQLGPTMIVRGALLSGAIDLYPEYTGNAAFFFNLDGDPVWKDAQQGYAKAAELDYARNRLVWLDPAPADNSWVIAVQKSLAQQNGLASLEDFARFLRTGGRIKLAASAEFVESDAGLPAYEAAYGFKLGAAQLLVLSGGATAATMKAAADGISGVNAAMAYATDGGLAALDLLALRDTLHAEPVYAPTPVVRAAALDTYPQIRTVLKPVFAGLDLSTLRRLNERIAVDAEDPKAVARDYFERQGILN